MKKIKLMNQKLIPCYAIKPLLLCLLINLVAYYGGRLLTTGRFHYDLTTPLDEALPVIPLWTIIYFSCYLFWIVNYIMAARESPSHCARFFSGEAVAKLLCFLCFLILPTTNIRPEIDSSQPMAWLLQLTYTVDAPDNLFPSIHCLISWFAWRGLFGCTKVARWYKGLSLFFTLLVFFSVIFTKQHVLVDILGGILFAETGMLLARLLHLNKLWYKIK